MADAYARAFINLPDRVPADEALPFSVACSDCTRAFPHEIGHNFGLRHDRYEWKQGETADNRLIDAPHPEAFGFAGPIDGDPDTDCIVTMMATGLQCVEGRIPAGHPVQQPGAGDPWSRHRHPRNRALGRDGRPGQRGTAHEQDEAVPLRTGGERRV